MNTEEMSRRVYEEVAEFDAERVAAENMGPAAIITEIDASDLIGRLVVNTNGAEFVVTGLSFSAAVASVVIEIVELDVSEPGWDTPRFVPHSECGVMSLSGWKICQRLVQKS